MELPFCCCPPGAGMGELMIPYSSRSECWDREGGPGAGCQRGGGGGAGSWGADLPPGTGGGGGGGGGTGRCSAGGAPPRRGSSGGVRGRLVADGEVCQVGTIFPAVFTVVASRAQPRAPAAIKLAPRTRGREGSA